MVKITGIRFKRAGKVYYFDPGELEMSIGQKAIVETVRGIEMGDIVISSKMIEDDSVVQPLKKIMRIATQEDLRHAEENKAKEPKALDMCHEKIRAHNLPMKLVGAEYTFDNSKIIFYFTAEGRVDFRELVKDLASVFKMRIELRQIGVRDEAKLVGGLGPCGLPMCCTTWLGDFDPVSIKMAKEQNLSLNPAKISGICGRLMCCLKYESGMYDDTKPRAAQRQATVPAPNAIAAPVCPGAVQCIGCDELEAKLDALPEDEEGLLVAVVDEVPGFELSQPKPADASMAPEKGAPQAETSGTSVEADRKAQVALSNVNIPKAGLPAANVVKKEFVPRKSWNDQKKPGNFLGQRPQGNANPKPAVTNKVDWQDFQAREKTDAPKTVENDKPAGIPGINPQGPRPVEAKRFNNRRRSHGHRREDGPSDPNGNPKGE